MGVVVLGAASVGFLRNKTFGLGGSVLSVTGMLLIGLSVWKNADVQVSDSGLTVKLDAVAEAVDKVTKANDAMTKEIEDVAKGADAVRQGSEEAINKIQAAVQSAHPTMAPLHPVKLAGPIYNPSQFGRINENLAASGRALLVARAARFKELPKQP